MYCIFNNVYFSYTDSYSRQGYISLDIYLLFSGWEVRIVKNSDRLTEATVSHYTDRPEPIKNIFIFPSISFKSLL